jgi:hypothetical protein
MAEMPRTLLPAGGVALGPTETIGSFLRGPSLRGLIAGWFKPAAEKAWLSSRALAFEAHPIGARRPVPGALYAFAYRYGRGWRVLYVGTRIQHKVDTAIGYGATHLLVRPGAAADEAWLIGDLKPPLNDGWR